MSSSKAIYGASVSGEQSSEKQTMGVCSALSSVDEYGFERPSEFDYKSYETFMSDYLSVLVRRTKKWEKLLDRRSSVGRNRTVKRYIRKGIPSKLRGKVWMAVSGAEARKSAHPGHYKKLLKGPKDPELTETISLDLLRTFPNNIYFKGKDSEKLKALSNVLEAFGLHNPSIGYCQGLNYITGLLLIIIDNEESVFWLLTVLLEEILPGYHSEDMTGVLTDIYVLGQIIRERKPLIAKHLEFNKVDLSFVVTKWFICLFVEVLPVETVLRIWDSIFYEGNKVILRVAVALILSNEEQLFRSQEFGTLIECFQNMTRNLHVLNCHNFFKLVFDITGPFPRAHINQLREEGRHHVISERKEADERRLNRKQETG